MIGCRPVIVAGDDLVAETGDALNRIPVGYLIFACIALVLSIKMLGLPFLYDDNELWGYNGATADLGDMLATFVPGGGDALLTAIFYRPLTHLSWWFDGMLWGDWVPGYRFTNLLLHLGGAYVCARLVSAFGGRSMTAVFAGLVFVMHVAHLETLGWVAARGDLLVTLFMGLGLLGYLSFERERMKLITVAGAYVAALLTKESALVFPLWIVATDILLRDRLRERAAWSTWAVLAAIGIAYLVMRWLAFGGLGGYQIEDGATHMSLLQDGDIWRRLKLGLRALLIPWPGLAPDAVRYRDLWYLMALLTGATILLGSGRMGLVKGARWAIWFLVIAVGTYLPSVVVEVGASLESSRVIYASSLSTVVWLALCFERLFTWLPRYEPVLSYLFLSLWALVFGLGIQPWDAVGSVLRELPHELRATCGKATDERQILFLNDDLGFYQGLRLFSSTPGAFSRSMRSAYKYESLPRVDWNHGGAAERFQVDYWAQNADRLGVDLFYVEWDWRERVVIDRTPMIREVVAKLGGGGGAVRQMVWDAEALRVNLTGQGGLTMIQAPDAIEVTCDRGDCWLAFGAPGGLPIVVEAVWHAGRGSDEAVLTGFYWQTSLRPEFDDEKSTATTDKDGDPIRARFEVPYTLEELGGDDVALLGFKIYPGLRAGKARLERSIFTYREQAAEPEADE